VNDYKTKSAIVIDNMLFAELAIKLSESFGRVQYFCESLHDPFPDEKKGKVGAGFPGVERVLDWESHIDENDIFIFPDINWGLLRLCLREWVNECLVPGTVISWKITETRLRS